MCDRYSIGLRIVPLNSTFSLRERESVIQHIVPRDIRRSSMWRNLRLCSSYSNKQSLLSSVMERKVQQRVGEDSSEEVAHPCHGEIRRPPTIHPHRYYMPLPTGTNQAFRKFSGKKEYSRRENAEECAWGRESTLTFWNSRIVISGRETCFLRSSINWFSNLWDIKLNHEQAAKSGTGL